MNHNLFRNIHNDFQHFRIKNAVERVVARVGNASTLLGEKLTKHDLIQMLKHDIALFRRMGLDPYLGTRNGIRHSKVRENVKYSTWLAHSIWSTIKRAQDQKDTTEQQAAPPATATAPQQPSVDIPAQEQQPTDMENFQLQDLSSLSIIFQQQPEDVSAAPQQDTSATTQPETTSTAAAPPATSTATQPEATSTATSLPSSPDKVTSDFVRFYQRRVKKYIEFNRLLDLATSGRVSGSWLDMGNVLYELRNIDPDLYAAVMWLNNVRRARREGRQMQINIRDPQVQKHMIELFRFGIFRLMYEANSTKMSEADPMDVLKNVHGAEAMLKETINNLYGKLTGAVSLTIEDVDRIIFGFAEDMNLNAQDVTSKGNFNTAQQIATWFSNLDPLQKVGVLLGIPLSAVGGLGMFMGGSNETTIALVLGLILLGMSFFSKDIQALFQSLFSVNTQGQQQQGREQVTQPPVQPQVQQPVQPQSQEPAQTQQPTQSQTQ